jgi:hypothetical protein
VLFQVGDPALAATAGSVSINRDLETIFGNPLFPEFVCRSSAANEGDRKRVSNNPTIYFIIEISVLQA